MDRHHVLADDTEEEELDAGEGEDREDQRRDARGNELAQEEEIDGELDEGVDEAQGREREADRQGETPGHVREGDQAVQRLVEPTITECLSDAVLSWWQR